MDGYAVSLYQWEDLTSGFFIELEGNGVYRPIDVGAHLIPSFSSGGLAELIVSYEGILGQREAIEAYFEGELGADQATWLGTPYEIAMIMTSRKIHMGWVWDSETADEIFSENVWADLGYARPYIYSIINGEMSLYLSPDNDIPFDRLVLSILDGVNQIESPPETATIKGTNSTDTVFYSGDWQFFDVIVDTIGNATVHKPNGTIDTLISVERAEFTDGVLLFGISSANADAAYRLYGGAFDRTPDEAGLYYWIAHLVEGGSLRDAAAGFIASPEFAGLYGAGLSDTEFVGQLYLNVLGRSGEAAGVEYWVDYLTAGGDRASALVSFTQLEEYVGLSQENIENGYWVV